MGEVVRLKDYCCESKSKAPAAIDDSMVPIEFAVGLAGRQQCLAKLAQYGIANIQIRELKQKADAFIYMITIQDALWLNKRILELEDLTEEKIAERIDLIQMLENIDLPMMHTLWGSITGGPHSLGE